MTLYSAVITLVLVMDPLGNIPLVLSMLDSFEPAKRRRILIRESIIAYVILVLFLYCGKYIMMGLNITSSALEIGGGIILFLISLKMIFPNKSGFREQAIGEPFVVPLAIPLIAGPSSMATVILFSTQRPHMMTEWFIAVTIASAISAIILLVSSMLKRVLGEKGLVAVERLMGMLLITISVQMFLSGISMYFKLG